MYDFCKKNILKFKKKYSVNEIKDNVAIQGVFETTFVLGTPMATLLGGWLVLNHKKEWNAINQHT